MARSANADTRLIAWNTREGGTEGIPAGFKLVPKQVTNPNDKEGEKVTIYVATTNDRSAAESLLKEMDNANVVRLVNNALEGLAKAKHFGGAKAELDNAIAEAIKTKGPDAVRALLASLTK